MKAFVSYVHKDGTQAHEFIECLKSIGYQVSNSLDPKLTKSSLTKSSFADALNDEIRASDLLVIMHSKHYSASSAVQAQSQAMRLHSDITGSSYVVIVNLTDGPIPTPYWQYKIVHASRDYIGGLSYFKRVTGDLYHDLVEHDSSDSEESSESVIEGHLAELQKAFSAKNLTVVCGAGVSRDAGLPDWSELLDRLLSAILRKLTPEEKSPSDDAALDAIKTSSSALILGRYLKAMLKDEFLPTVRDALYQEATKPSATIDAIVNLAAPRRTGTTLDSVITFNFDNLIERALKARTIAHKPIYEEGVRCEPDEIGIYHVHGYLPDSGPIKKGTSIVFSEDAYHDQFTDPFSWANLIQLAKYGQTTCLFVGLSLTDPNLRRLLDVSNRRDPQQARRHYIIQVDDGTGSKSRLVESMMTSDASELGLTSIRLESYADIGPFLTRVADA